MDLRERVTVETPEHVEFSWEVAGLGSRFTAGCVDAAFQGAGVLAVLLAFWAGNEAVSFADYAASALSGLLLLALFLLVWGYHFFFEAFRGGQSPGKRLFRIRVVAEGGHPCTVPRAAVRNLLRVVDFLPVPYGVAGLVMFLDPRGRRLGDLAAGTVVVRERGTAAPAAVAAARALTPEEREARDRLPPVEEEMVRAFLERRDRLAPEARGRLAAFVAGRAAEALGVVPGADPEAFLEAVRGRTP
ncbi:MAG: RDD family protein [Planctomycetes bacterium]|nr:RDD family protein [Planctomycetota bacterium]